MRRLVIVIIAFACSDPTQPRGADLRGDWVFLGLRGRTVETLTLRGSELYAGTDNGIYRASLGSGTPAWTAVGPQSRVIEAMLVLSADTLFAAVEVSSTGDDTVALFRTNDGGQSWRPNQNGFGGDTEAKSVLALAALPGQPDALLATGYSALVAKSDDGGASWRVVWGDWHLGGVGTHFIYIDSLRPGTVWVGGEGGRFQPFLLRSRDWGETWIETRVNVGGDNAHYTLAVDPIDPHLVYTGLEGRVMSTTDDGETWNTVLQPEDSPYFFGLSTSRVTPMRVYAAGAKQGLAADLRELRLYMSDDAGRSWKSSVFGMVRGGVRALVVQRLSPEAERVFLATGDGIWQFTPAAY